MVGLGDTAATEARSKASPFSKRAMASRPFSRIRGAAVAHVDVAEVAQQDGFGPARGFAQGFEHVAPVAGGDVEHPQRLAFGVQAGEGEAQEFFEVAFPLADAAPADGAEVVAIDRPADGAGAGGRVAIDVVEGAAGVEAGLMAEPHALGEQAAELHVGPVGRPVQCPRAEPRQRAGEGVGLVAGRAEAVGVAQVGTAQVGVAQVGAAQVGAAQVGVAQVGTAQIGTAQVGTAQVGACEVLADQIGMPQIDALAASRMPYKWLADRKVRPPAAATAASASARS